MFFSLAGTSHISQAKSLAPFASPHHLDPNLLAFLEKASSKLCRWLGEASDRGPLPTLSPLPDIPPSKTGASLDTLLEDLQLIMDGSYHPSNPGSLAHLDPPPLTASIAADLICAGLNNNLLAEELSPSLSRLERLLCRWFADRIGMPPSAGGVAVSGGSLANLMALVVARNHAGLQSDSKAVVVASVDAHVSLAKAIRVMGLGNDSLQTVPTDRDGRMSLEALDKLFNDLKIQDRKCFALVATSGTTVRGAIDPLKKLADYCAKEKIWFHVDAAIGGVFALAESTALLVEGISSGDSITVNPQKLLGIAKTSSLLLVAERSHLISTFSTGLPYLEPAWGEAHGGEMGLQGTRPAEVLKLWLGLRQLGEEGIQLLLEQAIQRRCYLESKLNLTKLRVISGQLHLLACSPKNTDIHKASSWSLKTRQNLLSNQLMLSRPLYHGRHYLKAVLGNPFTQSTHLDKLANILNESIEGFC